jgi:hypothetical protein
LKERESAHGAEPGGPGSQLPLAASFIPVVAAIAAAARAATALFRAADDICVNSMDTAAFATGPGGALIVRFIAVAYAEEAVRATVGGYRASSNRRFERPGMQPDSLVTPGQMGTLGSSALVQKLSSIS